MAFSIDSHTTQPTSLLDLLKNAAGNHPENGFLSLGDGLDKPATRVTYAELYARARVSTDDATSEHIIDGSRTMLAAWSMLVS